MHLPWAGWKLPCNARKTKPIMISIVFHDTFNYAAVLEAYARPPNTIILFKFLNNVLAISFTILF